ncbi:hypothetical protein AAC387_Pa01g2267 [Persea americana]
MPKNLENGKRNHEVSAILKTPLTIAAPSRPVQLYPPPVQPSPYPANLLFSNTSSNNPCSSRHNSNNDILRESLLTTAQTLVHSRAASAPVHAPTPEGACS